MNRRQFSLQTAAAAALISTSSARSYGRILGANERINLGIIGLGRRGTTVAGGFMKDNRVRITALCDVYGQRSARFQERIPVDSAIAFSPRYQELISRKDVDAVLIATPDHLHVQLACDTLAAGKHIYLEKPTVHRWTDRRNLQAAASRTGKVLQCGMQQRSGTHYARVKQEFFDTGRLGDVVMVRASWSNFPWQRRDIPPAPKPADLDWSAFLGPAPAVPYEYVRYTSWRSFPEYGSGVLADILTHWVDVAQWMLSDSKPLRASALGGIYNLHDERLNPDTVNAIVQYAKWNLTFESSVLSLRDDHPSVFFEGTAGSLNLTRGGYTYTPNEGKSIVFESDQDLDAAHARSFVDAVLTGSQTPAPLAAGLAATLPVAMALQSYWSRSTVVPEDLP